MPRGDSGYMSFDDDSDIFEKVNEELKQLQELCRIRHSQSSICKTKGGASSRNTFNLTHSHGDNVTPPPRIGSLIHIPDKRIPTEPSSEACSSNRSHLSHPSSEQRHSAPSSPPLLPLSRHPMSMPVSGLTTPIHRAQGRGQITSSEFDACEVKQTIPRHPMSMPISGSTTPICRAIASQSCNQVTSGTHKVAPSSSPPLLPLQRHPLSMPASGSTTPIHRETSQSTSDAHKIRQALLTHRKLILPEVPPELLDMPESPSSPSPPLKNIEEIPLSPYDFRDLIEQYYDDLDEMDTKLSEEMAAKNRKRGAAVREIVTTERTYVDGLNKCVEYFLKPLRDSCQKSNHRHTLLSAKPVVTLDEISLIFGNIEMILSLHQQLLKSLEERCSKWSSTELISDIFLQNAPFLKMYTAYVRDFARAIQLTERLKKGNKDFRKFLQSAQAKPELGGLPFNSYLSLPIQRIPRYKLLLEALLKHTEESHPDYPNLENCVKQITVIADEVNEKIKDAENQNRVLEIQSKVERCPIIVNPARRFICEGDLFKVTYQQCVAKKSSYIVPSTETQTHYLFNDLLVHCRKIQGKIVYDEQIDLNYASVVDIEDRSSDKPCSFKIVYKTPKEERHHIVRALDEYTKLDWMLKLDDAIMALKNGINGSYNADGRKLIPIRQMPQSSLLEVNNSDTLALFI
ncbi:10159_t:CDS:2 [Acaulospora colombiana]|uniref:10159_t:CDS:1 n=1 Tax=Acaulospora colombiana TaxID=27376 RepID=A0ACA9LTQ4_9GLOM|nr:10159_t:CDS:2 [Acaulospora colombiana]